ncbi:ubiquitin-like small modifier protein 1 [Streptomyces olivoreticuli]
MGITVHLPMVLRQYAGGAKKVNIGSADATVAEILDALESDYPGMRPRLLDEQGSLRRFVNIYVDDDDIRMAQGMETRVPDGADLSIIPAVAGGC